MARRGLWPVAMARDPELTPNTPKGCVQGPFRVRCSLPHWSGTQLGHMMGEWLITE